MPKQKSPLIFIVEDNPVYNKLVVNYLHSKKFDRVESFTSGEECLQRLTDKPDIIIQDYLLDGMNGLDVMKAAKKIDPHVAFIFLSGQDSFEVAINSIKFGAFDYIVKDQMALKKMVDKIEKIESMQKLRKSNKKYKLGITLFFIALGFIILFLFGLSIFFPDKFSFFKY